MRKGNVNKIKIRKAKYYTPEEVFLAFEDNLLFSKIKRKIFFDGDFIKANSQRIQTFKKKGCTCVSCGLQGTYFVKEKVDGDGSFHLNLYGINQKGKEILFTKDHIIPKSKGGIDDISNYQTMCFNCNVKKGNKFE